MQGFGFLFIVVLQGLRLFYVREVGKGVLGGEEERWCVEGSLVDDPMPGGF
jgi:hypothetical protein